MCVCVYIYTCVCVCVYVFVCVCVCANLFQIGVCSEQLNFRKNHFL